MMACLFCLFRAVAHRLPWYVKQEWVVNKESSMTLGLTPLVSLIAGILILVAPKMLNYIVAIYLIVVGLLGLFGGDIRLR